MSQEGDLGLAQCFTRASLYVGDLHNDVTEAILFEKFSAIGAILSIRVCRDKVTRRSLSYAYINFQLPADAERAIQTMNFDVVQGRPIRIMWSQRDPSLRKSGVGNIFIKNLEKSIDNKEVFDTFSEFGKILSCKVAQDANGVSKGYGFVHYEKEDSALKSIDTVNGMLLKGKKVFVGKFIPRRERENSEPIPKPFTNVYIKNFGEDFNDELLKAMFEKFGEITSHKVMKTEDGKSRGFGFVAFKEPVEALKAIEGLNGLEVSSGKALYVGPAQSKAERQRELRRMIVNKVNPFKGMNVFVKNLELGVDDTQLRQEFSRIGDITSAKVMLEQGRSKGFGFVCFTSAADAENAIAKMNGMPINGKAVYVALAQSKAERQAYLSAHPTYSHVKAPIVQHRSQDYVAPQLSQLASWSSGESSHQQMPRFAAAGSAWWGSAAAASNVYRYPQQTIRYAVSAGGTNFMEGRALRAAHHY